MAGTKKGYGDKEFVRNCAIVYRACQKLSEFVINCHSLSDHIRVGHRLLSLSETVIV